MITTEQPTQAITFAEFFLYVCTEEGRPQNTEHRQAMMLRIYNAARQFVLDPNPAQPLSSATVTQFPLPAGNLLTDDSIDSLWHQFTDWIFNMPAADWDVIANSPVTLRSES